LYITQCKNFESRYNTAVINFLIELKHIVLKINPKISGSLVKYFEHYKGSKFQDFTSNEIKI